MFSVVIVVAAFAIIASGQVTYNGSAYICPATGGDFCAGNSLSTNIILRCNNGVAQPGNCADNLAGEPPLGDQPNTFCWQTSLTSGDAACAKNCIVYCSSGNCPADFTLPDCTPSGVSSSSSTSSPPIIGPPTSSSTTPKAAAAPSTSITSNGTPDSLSNPTSTSPVSKLTTSNPDPSTSSPTLSTTVPITSGTISNSKTPNPDSSISKLTSDSPTSSPTTPVTVKQGGLSTGTKLGIGIGVAVGVLFFLALAAFTFWYGKRSVTKKRGEDGAVLSKAELGPGVPRRRELADTSVTLSAEEQGELERRRRAAELSGVAVNPVELSGEREELEILREKGRIPVEMD